MNVCFQEDMLTAYFALLCIAKLNARLKEFAVVAVWFSVDVKSASFRLPESVAARVFETALLISICTA